MKTASPPRRPRLVPAWLPDRKPLLDAQVDGGELTLPQRAAIAARAIDALVEQLGSYQMALAALPENNPPPDLAAAWDVASREAARVAFELVPPGQCVQIAFAQVYREAPAAAR
jgi:hypothetical protein